ncbi:MAG: DUF2961 domain-containing protein [Kiritimatiellaeota bacterium]|nr:DUF2961 domain-containing protein [Kiritimatiellota bacterium]
MKKMVWILSVFLAAAVVTAQDVSLGTLLDEMVDRDRLTRFPSPAYTSRMYSSYDRGSVAKDKPGWFANGDNSQFIRVEEERGRRELVMLDAKGPGAIVRWWHTGDNDQGTTLRLYIDGNAEPVFSGRLKDFISGDKLCGAPLSAYTSSGRNLYLPIPYAKSCKITYESPHVWAKEHGESCYYNIEARTYGAGVRVESFSMDVLKREQARIAKVNALLGEPLDWHAAEVSKTAAIAHFDGVIKPGQAVTRSVTGASAVRMLSMTLTTGDGLLPGKEGWREALRSTVIEMAFDGNKTVWAPAGDFFGTGYRFTPYKTRYTEVAADGRMFAAWVMPFQKECVLTVRNLGKEAVTVSQSALMTTPYAWGVGSMYFGAGWMEHNRVRTRKDNAFEKNDHWDVNYVTLTGEGVLVGTGVTVFNTCADWWGEGDEKIYIDGEAFPSYFGTGSEDYYGYAWCNSTPFMHPLIAQPYGNGNCSPDISINTRYRALDAIPFRKSIQFDMEMWHWADVIINYAPVTMWYMKPGGTSNRSAEAELAQMPVVTKRQDIYGVTAIAEGRLEGEALDSATTGGRTTGQSRELWSDGRQMWWIDGKPGAELTVPFHMKEAGPRKLTLCLTCAVDYGIVDLGINGQRLASFDGFVERDVITKTVELGTVNLKKGENTLNVKITGANERMQGGRYMFGLDYIDVKMP